MLHKLSPLRCLTKGVAAIGSTMLLICALSSTAGMSNSGSWVEQEVVYQLVDLSQEIHFSDPEWPQGYSYSRDRDGAEPEGHTWKPFVDRLEQEIKKQNYRLSFPIYVYHYGERLSYTKANEPNLRISRNMPGVYPTVTSPWLEIAQVSKEPPTVEVRVDGSLFRMIMDGFADPSDPEFPRQFVEPYFNSTCFEGLNHRMYQYYESYSEYDPQLKGKSKPEIIDYMLKNDSELVGCVSDKFRIPYLYFISELKRWNDGIRFDTATSPISWELTRQLNQCYPELYVQLTRKALAALNSGKTLDDDWWVEISLQTLSPCRVTSLEKGYEEFD